MSPVVRTTPQADAQILDIDSWWGAHRPSVPDLFLQELASSLEIISEAPFIGRVYRPSPVPGTRRVLLKDSRYHVYYVPGATEIVVLAVWHAQRGAGPPLRAGDAGEPGR